MNNQISPIISKTAAVKAITSQCGMQLQKVNSFSLVWGSAAGMTGVQQPIIKMLSESATGVNVQFETCLV